MKPITFLKRAAMLFMTAAMVISCNNADEPVVPTTIKLNKHQSGLQVGANDQLTAEVTPAKMGVTWSSSNTAVATVDQTGKVTAIDEGTATITATTADGKASDKCDVTVAEIGLIIDPETLTLNCDIEDEKMGQITATTDPVGLPVTWESSDITVATVDNTGKVTSLKKGTANITAKAGKVTLTCVVTVEDNSISVDPTTLSLVIGKDGQVTATVYPTNLSVSWESSNTAVATVDGNGKVHGVAKGTANIIAKAGGKSATCVVTVTTPFPLGVYVVGWERVGSLNFATMWKDGVQTRLCSNTDINSVAENIFVTGNDVYVAGGLDGNNTPSPKYAVYWKNGVETRLTGGTASSSANCIYVFGDNVYVGGYENSAPSGGHPDAKLWKDGIEQQLELTNRIDRPNSGIHGVFVADGHVYACGYDGARSVIWKDGAIQYLTPDQTTNDTRAYKILVSGGKVYAVGYYGNFATIWVDGVETRLTTAGTSRAFNLFIYDGDVYVTGYSNASGANQAMLWKNGISQSISLLPYGGGTDGTSQGYSVFVWQGDVFMAGHEYTGPRMYGKIWRNGESPKILTDGQYNAYVRSIFIAPSN